MGLNMQKGNLSYRYAMLNIAHKLIVINVVVFLVVDIVSFLFRTSSYRLSQWFVLPDELGAIVFQPWSLLTYSFLHFGFWHILFNMLWLNFFSRFVLSLFNEKRFLTVYLLGALYGGLAFVIGYNVFPVFDSKPGFLIGASASVSAIMAFAATYSPNTSFRFFTLTIKLWQIAVALIAIDLFRLGTGTNPGGMLAHLGGVIFGYVYATQLEKGKDIGVWFENSMDWFTNLFKSRKQKPFTKVHRNKTSPTKTANSATSSKTDVQKKIDAILDKISKSGYESLSKAEKDFLFKAGKED